MPGIDLIRLTLVRLYKGKNPFYGDRNHIHHLLLKKYDLSKTNIILALLGISPIILSSFFKLNFFIVLSIFILIYFYLIFKLRNNEL